MSKTATLSYTATKGRRNETTDCENRAPAHHIINWGPLTANQLKMQTKGDGGGRSHPSMERSNGTNGSGRVLGSASSENGSKNDSRRSNLEKRQSKQSASGDTGKSSGFVTPNRECQTPVNKKPDIKEVYAAKGVDYDRTRKASRMRLHGNGLLYDFYSPPPGYTAEDLPETEFSLTQEDPVSPAYLVAEQLRKERKQRRKPPSVEMSHDILQAIQTMRERKVSAGEKVTEQESPETGRVELSPFNHNESFPNDNDDSFFMAATQATEEQEMANMNPRVNERKFDNLQVGPDRKRDFLGNNKFAAVSNSPVPFRTSTPVAAKRVDIEETPKTARRGGLSRSRNRSCNSNGGSAVSLFEKSTSSTESLKLSQSEDTHAKDEDAPRKLLKFDESPIKCGEFQDDSDDEIFSQMVLPENETNGQFSSRDQNTFKTAHEKTTLITSHSDNGNGLDLDSFIQPELLGEIAKLEEMAIKSASSNSSSTSLTDVSIGAALVSSNSIAETPRTRSRRNGLSRRSRSKK